MRIFVLAFGLLLCVNANAQLDSLLGVLNKLPNDTSRLPVLTDLLRNTVFSMPDSGLHFAEGYRSIAQRSGIELEQGKGYNYTGMCYTAKGDHGKALENYLAALGHFEKGTDPWYTAMGHNNIASVLKTEKRLSDATVQFRKALKAFTQLGDSVWIANVNNNLANVEYTQGMIDSAAVHYAAADKLLTELEMLGFASQVRMNLANTYFDLGDPKKALTTMRSAYAIHPAGEDELNRAEILIGLGRLQGKSGIRDSALQNMREGQRIAVGSGALGVAANAEIYLSEYFEKIGRMDSALVHFKNATTLRDSLLNEERSAQISEMREKYESGKKDVELAENKAMLDQRSITIKAVSFGAVLSLLAGLFAFRAYRIKKRTSDELAEKNHVIDTQLKEKELLLREIHHRVKNNLQTVSSLLSLQGRSITDVKAKEAVQDSRLRVKSMALIHQDLYREGDLTGVRMKEYVEKLANGLITSFAVTDRVALTCEVQDIDLDVDTAVPIGLVLNELITNALKYAFPDDRSGTLRVAMKEQDGALNLTVRDNGIGYDPAAQRGEESTGFGLNMIRTFSTKLKAEWDIKNDNGTVVEMRIGNYKRAG